MRVDGKEQRHTLKLIKIEMYFSAILKHPFATTNCIF